MKATKKQAEAGAANLAKWQAEHPGESNLKHRCHSFLNGTAIPPEIQAELDTFESGIISDLGGDVTMAQRTLIANARRAYGMVLLGWEWVESNGVCDEDGDANPVLQMLVSQMNSLRLSLTALGLKRQPKQVNQLEEIMREHSH